MAIDARRAHRFDRLSPQERRQQRGSPWPRTTRSPRPLEGWRRDHRPLSSRLCGGQRSEMSGGAGATRRWHGPPGPPPRHQPRVPAAAASLCSPPLTTATSPSPFTSPLLLTSNRRPLHSAQCSPFVCLYLSFSLLSSFAMSGLTSLLPSLSAPVPAPPRVGHASSVGAHSVTSVTSHMVVMPQTCAAQVPPVVRQSSQEKTASHSTH